MATTEIIVRLLLRLFQRRSPLLRQSVSIPIRCSADLGALIVSCFADILGTTLPSFALFFCHTSRPREAARAIHEDASELAVAASGARSDCHDHGARLSTTRGRRIARCCHRCHTGLSRARVLDGYRDQNRHHSTPGCAMIRF